MEGNMHIKIQNPIEDQYGNSKENIFIAFSNEGAYLGSGYVCPNVDHQQIDEIPYLIFMDISIEENVEERLKNKVKQALFDKVFFRGKELRMKRLDLKARIYSGFEYNIDEMDFYIRNGFEEDYSIIMEASVNEDFKYVLSEDIKIVNINLEVEEELSEYKQLYDEIFISPLDADGFREQGKEKHFNSLYFLLQDKKCGGCTIFEREGVGYIETIYVLPEFRGKGMSKIILNYIFNYFVVNGLSKTKLEVWELNKPAVSLYKAFGYHEVDKNLMFPGINL